jgi:hypothetical protein
LSEQRRESEHVVALFQIESAQLAQLKVTLVDYLLSNFDDPKFDLLDFKMSHGVILDDTIGAGYFKIDYLVANPFVTGIEF